MFEPTPYKNGRCYVCGKPRKTVTRYVEEDAFCSTACCRAYFNVPMTLTEFEMEKRAKRNQERLGKQDQAA